MDATQVFAAQDVVGEGLVWDDRNGRLMWVDIIGRRIHALDPATLDHRLWTLYGRPTSRGFAQMVVQSLVWNGTSALGTGMRNPSL